MFLRNTNSRTNAGQPPMEEGISSIIRDPLSQNQSQDAFWVFRGLIFKTATPADYNDNCSKIITEVVAV